MNERLKEKMELAASLLNENGSVTPADQLPGGLLVQEGKGGLETDLQEALIADSVAHALKLAREQTHLTAKELAERRGLSKGRLSKIENGALNPTVGTLAEHADALGYDVTVVLTPRHEGQSIEVELPLAAHGQ
ncbi:helix-turn-helix transcriptional regulator [Deinococcus sp.]|uniref:helix-turn-helix domain-containing protein n=1 Tax=Deinococcus sp. TaxID=47478 RepID=UPI0025BF9657|nr:helix-turn-helix transcriptional regulator [Deinococcus sp.]